jgi:hypothetical chaperone protein
LPSFSQERQLAIAKGRRLRSTLEDEGLEYQLLVGRAATARYLAAPEEGYYLKSPKSFLGATGLSESQIQLFRDIVAAMMVTIKQRAEQALGHEIREAVIGQPVNFQGLGGEESNRQARSILADAAGAGRFSSGSVPVRADSRRSGVRSQSAAVAKRPGTRHRWRHYRLLRAAHGPERAHLLDRDADLLGHTGQRIGGNDFRYSPGRGGADALVWHGSCNKRGLPMPSKLFWDAMAINDVQPRGAFSLRRRRVCCGN